MKQTLKTSQNPSLNKHELIDVPIDDIKLDPTNPNQMTQKQMQGLKQSMERWGYLTPVIIDQNNQICDGEHRYLVYKQLGYDVIPAFKLNLENDSERLLIRQVMNKLHGEHDRQLDSNELATIFQHNKLEQLSSLIAQQQTDLQCLISKYHPDIWFHKQEDFDPDKALEEIVPTTQLGDIYELGNHKLYCGDNSAFLPELGSDSIDLTITSPPYDDLRDYHGYKFEFESTAASLYGVTKQGGVVVWVVGDQVIEGSETLSSFKQAIYFKDIGFNVHDTMIYAKSGIAKPMFTRYHQAFEYMFVISKGNPKTFNPLKDRENTTARTPKYGRWFRQQDGQMLHSSDADWLVRDNGMRFNVWLYDTGYMHMTTDKIAYEHPAIFPIDLAKDHIHSWSNDGDTVLDPFCGSGTTLMACEFTNRNCIGIELDPHYCDVIIKRWQDYTGKQAVKLS